MDWSTLYPDHFLQNDDADDKSKIDKKLVEFADVGCGYGGLLGMNMFNLKLIFII